MQSTIYYDHYLIPDLILKESEEFYQMIHWLKLKSHRLIDKFLKIFSFFPSIIDGVTYLIFRFNFQ